MADAELDLLLSRVTPLLVAYVAQHADDAQPVCEALPPHELEAALALALPEAGQGVEGAVRTVRDVLRYSVRTGHPRFLDKLYAGSDAVGARSAAVNGTTTPTTTTTRRAGMVAELVTAALNTNLHVYSVAPVFTLMELRTVRELGEVFGFGAGADGVSCPGGSYSNMLAMVTARSTLVPSTKAAGQAGARLVVLTSADAHYSISKNAILTGVGLSNVVKVPTTPDGRMVPEQLRRCIARVRDSGAQPFFINATAGTTVTGAFDDFHAIAAIARESGCWMHVDACWGGAVAFSSAHRHLIAGIEKADSIAWNAHKMMGVPIQSSILLVRQAGLLQRCNALGAGYLFHDESEYDLGDKTMQCGRRPDILKLYMAWQYHGREGFERRVRLAFDNVALFVRLLRERGDVFRLMLEPVFVNVCFWFWPRELDEAVPAESDRERVVGALTAAVHAAMVARGRVLVDFSPAAQGPAFFRIIVQAPNVRQRDLDEALDEIEQLGRALLPQHIAASGHG